MKGFIGLKLYQDFCRKDVMEKGYILLNPVTRHKAYIYDYAELIKTASTFTQEFWQQYRELKAMGDTDNSTVYSVKKERQLLRSSLLIIEYKVLVLCVLNYSLLNYLIL